MKLYRVKGWTDHYENNRTRELKSLAWVPIPNDQDGDGYTLIMDQPDGAAIYGAWIACVQVASKCDPRGTLMRGCKTPHNAASLSRMTRVPIKIIERMINVCERECKWLESNDMQDGATIPQDGATIPQDGAPRVRAQNGMEWNGMEEKEGKGSSVADAPNESPQRMKNLHDDPPTFDQCRDANSKLPEQLTESQLQKFYDHYQTQGWFKKNQLPAFDIFSLLRNWKRTESIYGNSHSNSKPTHRNGSIATTPASINRDADVACKLAERSERESAARAAAREIAARNAVAAPLPANGTDTPKGPSHG